MGTLDGEDMDARGMTVAVRPARTRFGRFGRVRASLLALFLTVGTVVATVPGFRRVDLGDLQPVASIRASQGYWLVAEDGGVFAFGDARFLGARRNREADIIGMARTADGTGLFAADDDGDVFHYGNAINYGSRLVDTNDIRSFAVRPSGDGYWMATKDGSVFVFGAAPFLGPFVPLNLNRQIVAMAATPSGNGYWLVGRDGGIFSYGDARFYGSTGGITLNQPIVGMAATPSGQGYWLVAADGGIFSYGDARFFGSTGGMALNRPIVGMGTTGTGNGYWLVASDGGIFSYGDARFFGSTGGMALNRPIVGMVPTRVLRSNDFPAAASDSVVVTEDIPATVDVLANDGGLSDGGITVSVLEGPAHGAATVDASGRIVYTPAANYFGPDGLTYAVADVDGDQSSATVAIAVTGVNDVPVAPDQALFTPEETPATGFVGAGDADGDPLSYSITSPPAHGTATVAAGGFFTYTPSPDYNGNDAFTVTVSDGRGGTDTARIGLSVGSINDPPVAGDQSVSTPEDTPVTGAVVATDPEGDSFTYSIGALPAHGTATIDAAGSFTYAPVLDYVGADSFTVVVDDGHGGTAIATVAVTVTDVNDPPLANDQSLSVDEDTLLPGAVGATDPDGDVLTYSVTGNPAHGSVTVNNAGGFAYTPALNYFGTDAFTITVTDGRGGTDTATVNVTVLPINDSPVASNQSLTTDEDTQLNGSLGATDPDGDALGYSVTGGPAHGTASVNGSGNFTYMPDANYNGGDSFTITVGDGSGGTDTATISVTVTAVNDAPVAVADFYTSDGTTIGFNVANNDSDPDGSLVVSDIDFNDTTAFGTLSCSGSGDCTYTPDAGLLPGVYADTFTYAVIDADGAISNVALVTITITIV